MSTFVVDAKRVHIPVWVQDLPSFRRWAHTDDFPESGRISFIHGEVWVDMSKEQFVHNQIKGEMGATLMPLAKRERLGRYFPDGYLLSNDEANLSTNPDGMFVSKVALLNRRARLVPGSEEGLVELHGSPDMVLEVISPSTIEKDTVVLRKLYALAGITEYWLVNPWAARLEFDILRLGSRGYTATRKQGGWLKSAVFGKSFRLVQQTDELGYAEYSLEMK
ncbi:MAG: Uma2 family endonuclease [Planctomycetia bacterium]|nr:Uma2 family endonuclease [Planctomycetia bacterium]